MEFFDVIKLRRSVREYTNKPVPLEVINRALDAAIIAPNSSNMQSWEFYWVRSSEKRAKLVHACLNQSAAKTAQELIVFVATTKDWKRNSITIADHLKKSNAPQMVLDYYLRLMPFLYGFKFLAPIKFLIFKVRGIFRPTPRRPWSSRDNQEVALKSSALAAENFMLAITAQNFDTCPMEGFDEVRVKKILNLSCCDRVTMVISVGERDSKGVWGDQFRLPRDWFVKEV